MKFKPYPRYKDSGIEWLGEVPEGWIVLAIKRLTNIGRGASPRPIDDPKYFDENGGYLWTRISDVSASNVYLYESPQKLSALGASLSIKLEPGSLFLSIAGTVGKACITARKACIHDGFVYFSNLKENSKYFFYIFESGELYKGLGKMNTQLNLNTETVGSIKIAVPSRQEQTAITNFLDRETRRIDALVEEKNRFIELLKEKRQALISHAVTKGLDPTVKMKDSEIEWLGEVPAHWEVLPIKYMVSIPVTDGPHETPDFIDEGIPFVSAEAVSSGEIDFNKIRGFLSKSDHLKYSKKYYPRVGDIFIIKSGATTGVSAIVKTNIEFNIWSPLAVARCGKKSNSFFVLNFLRSKNFQDALALNWSFGTQQNIGMGVIENLRVTVPPISEQTVIANFIDCETAKIDALITETQNSIALLKEHRIALISAAVTGKIDVRETA